MKSSNQFDWWQIEINVPSEIEETLFWKFESLGILRTAVELNSFDTSQIKFLAWVPICEWEDKDLEALILSLRPLADFFSFEIPTPALTQIADEDWSNSWKKHWKPDPVGINFLVLPAWLDIPLEFSSRVVLRLDPGSAFGTGSHPSTRLCLEAIERFPMFGKIVADIGCGSGILTLAALKKGAKKVFATDIDSLAVKSTSNNVTLNNLDNNKIQVELGSINELELSLSKLKVDLLLCNIIAPVIEELAPKFNDIISPNGIGFLSGILTTQVPILQNSLHSLGWKIEDSFEKEKWSLLTIKRF